MAQAAKRTKKATESISAAMKRLRGEQATPKKPAAKPEQPRGISNDPARTQGLITKDVMQSHQRLFGKGATISRGSGKGFMRVYHPDTVAIQHAPKSKHYGKDINLPRESKRSPTAPRSTSRKR